MRATIKLRVTPHAAPTVAHSRQDGFSLVQIMVAVALVGILGSMGFARLSTVLKQKTLQGEIEALAGLIQQSRSVALKKNLPVGLMFDKAANVSRIYEDADGSGSWQAGESMRSVSLGKDVAIGPPLKSPPTRGPSGAAVPNTGLAGTWAASLLFAKDAMATPSAGALYLHHPRLDTWTACLIRTPTSQQIQAYVWDGTSWRLL